MGCAVSVIATLAFVVTKAILETKQLKQLEEEQRRKAELLNQASATAAEAELAAKKAMQDSKAAELRNQQAEQQMREALEKQVMAETATGLALEEMERAEARRRATIKQDFGDRPSHLQDNDASVVIGGLSGAGKTSWYNAVIVTLFQQLLTAEEQQRLVEGIPFGEEGITETTMETQFYRIPGKQLVIADIPGHGTFNFGMQQYIRMFSIAYYGLVLYVFANRLCEADLLLILNFLLYDVNFRLVRQKFGMDLKSHAGVMFKAMTDRSRQIFDNERYQREMNEFIKAKIMDAEFVEKTKNTLREELTKNWKILIEESKNSFIQERSKELVNKLDLSILRFVDSNDPTMTVQ